MYWPLLMQAVTHSLLILSLSSSYEPFWTCLGRLFPTDDAHILFVAANALLLVPVVPGVGAPRGGGGGGLLLQVTRWHPLARGRGLEAPRGQEDPRHRGGGRVTGDSGGRGRASAGECSGQRESGILNCDDLTSGGRENLERREKSVRNAKLYDEIILT